MYGKCIPFNTLFPLHAAFQGCLKLYRGYDSISIAVSGQSRTSRFFTIPIICAVII